jgi:hypothetical protein
MAYKQVGISALRSPTGEFLPAVPLYAEVAVNDEGKTEAEELAAWWAARLAAEKIRAYTNGRRKSKRKTEGTT